MNNFEIACEEVEKDRNYELSQENVISFLKGKNIATVCFSQGRYISKIRKLAEKFPEEVQITAENKDGSIVAHIPVSYIRISKITREMSEEQKEANRERLRSYRQNSGNE